MRHYIGAVESQIMIRLQYMTKYRCLQRSTKQISMMGLLQFLHINKLDLLTEILLKLVMFHKLEIHYTRNVLFMKMM